MESYSLVGIEIFVESFKFSDKPHAVSADVVRCRLVRAPAQAPASRSKTALEVSLARAKTRLGCSSALRRPLAITALATGWLSAAPDVCRVIRAEPHAVGATRFRTLCGWNANAGSTVNGTASVDCCKGGAC